MMKKRIYVKSAVDHEGAVGDENRGSHCEVHYYRLERMPDENNRYSAVNL